jgi:hypothetical protein
MHRHGQGVVVQIIKQTAASSASACSTRPRSISFAMLSFAAGKFTKMLGDAMSLYSSSASASAVSHPMDQWIGLSCL